MDNDNEKALQTFQRELAKLYASLSPKEQRKAIAASMRREANRLKKAAQTRYALRASRPRRGWTRASTLASTQALRHGLYGER